MPRALRSFVLVAALALSLPGHALGAESTLTFRSSPITIGPFGVAKAAQRVDSPAVDGHVVAMNADVVDSAGNVVPDHAVMLHHVVFAKVLTPDYTCPSFRDYTGRSLPFAAERFYAEGEERQELELPSGFGYPNRAQDVWGMIVMLMNHHNRRETVHVRYTLRYVTGESLRPVRPIWLDVRNCTSDSEFTVPGTGGRGSTHARRFDFRLPESGQVVAGGGHLHGGGIRLELANQTCGSSLFTSLPTWGVGPPPQPVMHEEGPAHMSRFTTARGIDVSAGDVLRLEAVYDNSLPHVRAMGIMMIFLAPGPAVPCAPVPALDVDEGSPGPPPRVVLPLLRQPRGKLARDLGATWVGDYRFGHERVSIRRGRTFTWRFVGQVEHDVTLANGPVGLASPAMERGRYRFRFSRPGVYRLFCSLHPTRMTQAITVRR